jgi:hypothetical protein
MMIIASIFIPLFLKIIKTIFDFLSGKALGNCGAEEKKKIGVCPYAQTHQPP